MTAKAALIYHLLKGDVLTVFNVPKIIGYTNVAREVSREVEKPFKVKVSKNRVDTKNRYESDVFYFEYRLNRTEYNAPGIEKMKAYLRDQAKGHSEEVKFLKVCNPTLF